MNTYKFVYPRSQNTHYYSRAWSPPFNDIYVHTYIYPCVYTYTCIHTYIHVYIQIHTHIYPSQKSTHHYSRAWSPLYLVIRSKIYIVYIYEYIYVYIHIHMHMHIYIYIHAPLLKSMVATTLRLASESSSCIVADMTVSSEVQT